ncbi:hypothetical protein ACS0KJ_004666, partial [Vibrio parahaemolyticus]
YAWPLWCCCCNQIRESFYFWLIAQFNLTNRAVHHRPFLYLENLIMMLTADDTIWLYVLVVLTVAVYKLIP